MLGLLLLGGFYLLVLKNNFNNENNVVAPIIHSEEKEKKQEEAVATYSNTTVNENPFQPLVEEQSKKEILPSSTEQIAEANNQMPAKEEVPVQQMPDASMPEQEPESTTRSTEEEKPQCLGIMGSEKGYSALIKLGEKNYIVKTGTQIEKKWGVVSINQKRVVLNGSAGLITLPLGKEE